MILWNAVFYRLVISEMDGLGGPQEHCENEHSPYRVQDHWSKGKIVCGAASPPRTQFILFPAVLNPMRPARHFANHLGKT